jgi:hypothetical protein
MTLGGKVVDAKDAQLAKSDMNPKYCADIDHLRV